MLGLMYRCSRLSRRIWRGRLVGTLLRHPISQCRRHLIGLRHCAVSFNLCRDLVFRLSSLDSGFRLQAYQAALYSAPRAIGCEHECAQCATKTGAEFRLARCEPLAKIHGRMLERVHPTYQTISVEISICFVGSGATPTAIASAIIPSMRPVDFRLLGLRLPASSIVMTVLVTHMVRTG